MKRSSFVCTTYKKRQRTTESVDEYAQEFEALFDKSYGKKEWAWMMNRSSY